ncbi:MAG: DUF2093 domain-containing protein [Hyphomicrobiaceae bacterium]|nr:DUF2093 domain-containing protein [Hyphomicrobiaceae bacterium]
MPFPNRDTEAVLRYGDGEFDIVTKGTFVTCAVTGRPIALEDLKYWSVERQEAYADAESSMQAELRSGSVYRG